MKIQKARGASIVLGLLAAGSAGFAFAESTVATREASIPFANQGGIWTWEADHDRGLWVQANNHQWYYAKFFAPCYGLNFSNALAFDTRPAGTLDRWSSVTVPNWGTCTFTSLEPSDGPPPR